ncbi:phosphate-starvation-inducible PsiE family protein [Aurantibacter sp.]|uniref:phosphate-starvation-inducible PsiE family protein n=1 Tax=Aurantibacter sp. TaxID=2807103 RepID=UPI0035C7FE43
MTKDKILDKTEDIVYLVLSILAILFILFEIIDLVYTFYSEVSEFSFNDKKSIALTGVPIFFNILITLEILETFKEHHKNILSRIKIIILVALTAIVRKIITLDIKHTEDLLVISISTLVISLCLGYYFLSKKTEYRINYC